MTLPPLPAFGEEVALPPVQRKARTRNEIRRSVEVVLPGLLVLVLQVLALIALWRGQFSLIAYGCFHVGVVLAAIGWAYSFRRGGQVNRFAVLLAVVAGAFGPIGTLGLILIVPLQVLLRRSATPFAEWYAALFPEVDEYAPETLYQQISSGRADDAASASIDSFTDIMRIGSLEQKQAVIALLVRQFRPEFAPAMKLALQDFVPAVRVQAATAVAEIESDFLEQAIALENKARANLADFDAAYAVARHYDTYAFCGLLDEQRESETRRLALDWYESALALQPHHIGVRTAISRILVREERYSEAVDWLGNRLEGGRTSRALVAWYAECLFHLQRYEDLRGVAIRFRDLLLGDRDHEDGIAAAIRFWLEPPKAAANTAAAETDDFDPVQAWLPSAAKMKPGTP